MKGWRFVFLQDVVSPAEIPVEMNAFKSQQHRWAKGSIQTCKKLLPKILASDLPLTIKVEAAFHLTANFAYPLMILLSILMFPAMVIRYNMGWYEMLIVDVPLFIGATMSVCSFYLMSQREIFGDEWRSRIKYLPAVLSVGIGLSVNNAKAVMEALLGLDSEFTRTPKYRVEVRRRRLEAQALPRQPELRALHRAPPGRVLHRHGLLRRRQRHLRHAAFHLHLPVRIPLRRPPVALPGPREARASSASRKRNKSGGHSHNIALGVRDPPVSSARPAEALERLVVPNGARVLGSAGAARLTRLPTPSPGNSGKGAMMSVAAPLRGSMNTCTRSALPAARSLRKRSQAPRLGSSARTSSSGTWRLLTASSAAENSRLLSDPLGASAARAVPAVSASSAQAATPGARRAKTREGFVGQLLQVWPGARPHRLRRAHGAGRTDFGGAWDQGLMDAPSPAVQNRSRNG